MGWWFVSVDNIVPFIFRLVVKCPACGKNAKVEWSRESKLWFPIPFEGGYCCDVMRLCDSAEWNELLDQEIERAKTKRRAELSKVVIG